MRFLKGLLFQILSRFESKCFYNDSYHYGFQQHFISLSVPSINSMSFIFGSKFVLLSEEDMNSD